MPSLIRTHGAKVFFAAAFLNAFVDLGHKITIQNTIFKIYDGSTQVVLTAVVNGLILLPFIFLFIPAGKISDRFARHRVMQISGWFAVFLTLGIAVSYHMGWFVTAFAMTFLLAAQSAIYSPAKFAYLKSLFGAENLARANGALQSLAIVAILAATFAFSLLFERSFSGAVTTGEALTQVAGIGWMLVAGALIELACLYRLPDLKVIEKALQESALGPKAPSRTPLQTVLRRPVMGRSILGISLFWGIGQVMLAAFPAFAEMRTGVTNAAVVQGVLAMSGIGIAIGAYIAGQVSKNYIETGLIPVGALGICGTLWCMPFADSLTTFAVLQLIMGIAGGMFLIPLNAMVQFHADERELGGIISVRNLFSNLAMLGFLAATIGLTYIGFNEQFLLILLAVVAFAGTIYTVANVPQSLTRFAVASLMSQRYRLKVQGVKNIPASGGALLLGNHISFVDWAMIQIASPRPVRFVMAEMYYNRWYLKWIFDRFGCIPIASGPSSKSSLEAVSQALISGDLVCLFPEGKLTSNGQLGEFRRGYETACNMTDTDIPIVPFYLQGLWGSRHSRSSASFKDARAIPGKRDVVVTFGEALPSDTPAHLLKRKVSEVSVVAWEHYASSLPSLAVAWVDKAKTMGKTQIIHDDLSGDLSAYRALTGAVLMSKRISELYPEQNVGLALPFTVGGVLANMATLLAGKTLVNLNYTASAEALQFACRESGISKVITAKRFITNLQKRGIELQELLPDQELIYLEDVRESFSKTESLTTLLMVRLLPTWLLKKIICKKHNPAQAAIIFSSGSEGLPKGIILSHKNLMANVKQAADALQPDSEDVMMSSLPLFHAFGLTAAQFLPLIEGMPMVCQPDPTDVVSVAKAVAKYKATIMFGTSTFLRFYCRNTKVHPLMLESLRLTVAGAEKLSADVRQAFEAKFRKPIYEGYGMTECSPVVGVNLPDQLDSKRWQVSTSNKVGTIGQPLSGTSLRIADPESLRELETGEEGMVLVAGPQVMSGYLNAPSKTAEVLVQQNGITWYVSGDKGRLDEDGFLTLIDRYSRMAKLGGEMISLGAVEQLVRPALIAQEYTGDIVATSVEDKRKGEKLVVLLDEPFDQKAVIDYLKKNKANSLMRPSIWIKVEEIPRLGAGKVDFPTAKKLAIELS
jgi:acyl-[acyl-carrier-protein]-phospholipid O-acyltransferase/long-chain-fatty-acid--[acyl-carrier-protein] ligase